MFEKLTKKLTSRKDANQNQAKKALSEFNFLSKLSKFQPDDVIKIADSFYEETSQATKYEKANQLRELIEQGSLSDLIKYMKCDNEIARSIAAQVFSNTDSPNLLDCITAMLKDDSTNLRISCMETLAHMETPLAISLFKQGMSDNSASVRMKAAIGLADLAQLFNNKEAINLLNAHITDPDDNIREFILDELGLIGNESTVKELFKAMDSVNEEEKERLSESLSIILSKTL